MHILPVSLYDSYQRRSVVIDPKETVEPGKLKLYHCGPTVYLYQSIGNLQGSLWADTVSKVFDLAGWQVDFVENITDVGHLVGDGDDQQNVTQAEDKMEKGARLTGLSVDDIVHKYNSHYRQSAKALGLDLPSGQHNPKATNYISQQMVLALELLRSGRAYLLKDGIYFDSLANQDLDLPNLKLPTDQYLYLQDTHQKDLPTQVSRQTKILVHDLVTNRYLLRIPGTTSAGIPLSSIPELEESPDTDRFLGGEFLDDLFIQTPKKVFSRDRFTYLGRTISWVYLDDIGRNHRQETDLWYLQISPSQAITPKSQFQWQTTSYIQTLSDPAISAILSALTQYSPVTDLSAGDQLATKSSNTLKNPNYTGREIKNTFKNSADFALWKFVDPKSLQKWRFADFPQAQDLLIAWFRAYDSHSWELTGLNSFDLQNILAAWGCPGWHSECVAMICSILGKIPQQSTDFSFAAYANQPVVIDLHMGGEDHIPIHHYNEILQSRAMGFELSRFWVHNRFVLVDGQKMSKSLGNVYLVLGSYQDTGFYTLQDPPLEVSQAYNLKHGFDPLAYRLMLLEHHYRQQVDFTWDKLWQSQNRLFNLRKEMAKIESLVNLADTQTQSGVKILISTEWTSQTQNQKKLWLEMLTADLRIPEFLNSYGDYITHISKQYQTSLLQDSQIDLAPWRLLLDFEKRFCRLNLGNSLDQPKLHQLAKSRLLAKNNQDYALADDLRHQLKQQAWQVDDYAWGYGLWYNPV